MTQLTQAPHAILLNIVKDVTLPMILESRR